MKLPTRRPSTQPGRSARNVSGMTYVAAETFVPDDGDGSLWEQGTRRDVSGEWVQRAEARGAVTKVPDPAPNAASEPAPDVPTEPVLPDLPAETALADTEPTEGV